MNSINKNINMYDAYKVKIDEAKRKRKNGITTTYTTGDIQKNVDHFNKMLIGKATNTHTDGLPSMQFNNKSAEADAKSIGTFASQSPDGASSISSGDGGGDSGSMSEQLLREAKRYVRRYYIRPQNIFASSKIDIIKALIDIDKNHENCSIYTLNNLVDNNDVTKLTNKDIIYYYDDGILYDKNHIKVMDYNLMIKHEENRDKIDINNVSDNTFKDTYDDRMTDLTVDEDFNLSFNDVNAYGERLIEGKEVGGTCCICGEGFEGYGNNPEPYMSSENGERCCNACNWHFVIPARLEMLDRDN